MGIIKEDFRRDVFWQRSFVETDDGKIICKIIVCASQEFLATSFNEHIMNIHIDEKMISWFNEKTTNRYEKNVLNKNSDEIEFIFDIYPQIDSMLQFAKLVSETLH